MKNLDTSIERGLLFIANQQNNDGSFDTVTSTKLDFSDNLGSIQTVFGSVLIAKALASCKRPIADNINEAVISWLLTQRNNQTWAFNYWQKDSTSNALRPYPDDLDDTFCALSLLYQYRPALFGGRTLASIANLLFQTETEEGGPYRTWLVSDETNKEWQAVDPAVNANIATFLAGQNVMLPGINLYFDNLLSTNSLQSQYYPTPFSIYYFMSPWYRGDFLKQINKLVIDYNQKNLFSNPQQSAMCLIILIRNKHQDRELLNKIQNFILQHQNANGSWPGYPAWIDSHLNGLPIYAGSKEYSTALCIEALQEYQRSKTTNYISEPKDIYSEQIKEQATGIIDSITQEELQNGVRTIYQRIIDRDEDQQILKLPVMVAQSIASTATRRTQQQLSSVSLWGWMAYTTYDDIQDEGNNRMFLPAANYSLRQMATNIRSVMPQNNSFQKEATSILNRIDAANSWEAIYCRVKIKGTRIKINQLPEYGNYWQLADRSLGHTIAGIGVLYATGFSGQSNTTVALRSFFKYYLIARQLSDDAHDWEQDLKHGIINSVGTRIIQKYFSIHEVSKKIIDIEKDTDFLRSLMWNQIALDICNDIERNLHMAKEALVQKDVMLNPAILLKILTPVETAVKNTRLQQSKAAEFVESL